MSSSLKDKIKKIDVLRIIPDDAKESTIVGVAFSAFFTLLAVLLFLNEFWTLVSVKTESQLLIDHMKDDKDIVIDIDIEMPGYPCGLLSLDKMDVIHSHIVDVEEGLKKFRLNDKGVQIGKFIWSRVQKVEEIPFEEKLNTVQAQISAKEGCRVVGNFTVKAVPGNFHISFHNYGDLFQYLMQRGLWEPDMSHRIKMLRFGGDATKSNVELMNDFGLKTLHTLDDMKFENLIKNLGFPHEVKHKIKIVPSKFEYSENDIHEMYQYTATTYQIGGMAQMRILFDFDIENLYMYYKRSYGSFWHFLVNCCSIFGGLYTSVLILKMFLEDGILRSIYKKKIGKLE